MGYRFHFFKKVLDFQMRQIFLYIFAVLDNIGIRRMSTDKINAVIRNKVQMTCITFVYINLTIRTLVLEIYLFSATCKGNMININTYDVTIE